MVQRLIKPVVQPTCCIHTQGLTAAQLLYCQAGSLLRARAAAAGCCCAATAAAWGARCPTGGAAALATAIWCACQYLVHELPQVVALQSQVGERLEREHAARARAHTHTHTHAHTRGIVLTS